MREPTALMGGLDQFVCSLDGKCHAPMYRLGGAAASLGGEDFKGEILESIGFGKSEHLL
ncbi:hypothetical protein N9908_00190 [Akkermansiaceae bacterium]|nr:hypothetical protein [Akkermansiaceae bacterium]